MAAIEYDARDDEMLEDVEEAEPAPAPRLRSKVAAAKKQKGRGFKSERDEDAAQPYTGGRYESLAGSGGAGPQKSVEGWVVFVTNIHEEAQEDDLTEAFADFGDIKNIYLNLDRRTGYVKGYALIEYASRSEAQAAIDAMDGQEVLTQSVKVTWAFQSGPIRRPGGGRAATNGAGRRR